MSIKTPVVVDCVRTPIGRAHPERGWFRDVRSDDLAVACAKALIERTGIDPGEIEDVVVILTEMPRSKQARIVGQFTDPEEAEAMDEVLRLIRQGEPKISLIDRTRDQLEGIQ